MQSKKNAFSRVYPEDKNEEYLNLKYHSFGLKTINLTDEIETDLKNQKHNNTRDNPVHKLNI